MRGIYRWPVDSPLKGSVTRKTFTFDNVIMYFICDKITLQQLQYGCTIMSSTTNLMLNLYLIEFVSENMLIYLRFLLFMKADMARIVEIPLRGRQSTFILHIQWHSLVMTSLLASPGNRHPCYDPVFSKYSGFSTSRVKMTLDVCSHRRYDDIPLTNISARSYYLHDKIISYEFTGECLCHQENIVDSMRLLFSACFQQNGTHDDTMRVDSTLYINNVL